MTCKNCSWYLPIKDKKDRGICVARAVWNFPDEFAVAVFRQVNEETSCSKYGPTEKSIEALTEEAQQCLPH